MRDRRRRHGGRSGLLLAGSLAAHALILGVVGWRAVAPIGDPERSVPPILLTIEPRPLLAGEDARPPAVSGEAELRPLTSPADVRVAPLREEEDEQTEGPTVPAPRLSQPAPGALPPPPGSNWTVRPEAAGDRMARALRIGPVGCNMRNGRMSEREQALCDEAFNQAAARARPIEGTGDPARDAAFAREGERALAQYEAQRRPLAGGTGNVGVGDCPGSNLGIGCAGAHLEPRLRQGARTTIQQSSNKVD